MNARLTFVHTVCGIENTFTALARRHLPEGTALTHIADESLIQRILAAGGLTEPVERRVCDHVAAAEEAGADYVQLTCSSVTPVVPRAQRQVSVPVLAIDTPMIEEAVRRYERIGVIATNPGTLRPSTEHVRSAAEKAGRTVEVTPVLCSEAYDAFFAGDLERHDRLVREQMVGLMERADVVLLAQASMARVAETLDESEQRVPVLTSPEPAMKHLAELMGNE